ncbi:hypothetical protein MXB_634 [Myxobolus squamalis]|nr:hypothetical protein MXB_634 [Myxobolus squamalis]
MRAVVTDIIAEKISLALYVNERQMKKFVEAFWLLTFYLTAFAINCGLIHRYQLINSDRDKFFDIHFGPNPLTVGVGVARIFQTSYYLQSLYSIVFVEKPRSDFLLLIVHHLCTIFLQLLSYSSGFMYAAITVEFLHDINQIFLNSAKICKYISMGTTKCSNVFKRAARWHTPECGFITNGF